MTYRKPCSACGHAIAYGPTMCGRFLEALTNRPRLAQPLREPDGPCGPNGSAFEPIVSAGAIVLDLPIPHRRSA